MSGIVGSRLNNRGSGLIGSLGTDGQVLTSSGAGVGAVYEAGAIDDNAVTLAKMAGLARGKLIYGDTSGDPAALAVGGANEVLTHDGTDFDWAAAGGGGKIGQVVTTQAMAESAIATHSTSFVTTGVVASITPVAVTSKILISVTTGGGNLDTANNSWIRTIYRDAIDLGSGDMWFCNQYSISGLQGPMEYIQWLDSPSTASEVDYTVFHKTGNAAVTGWWCWDGTYYNMTLMEVLA